jgi:hypothetical protein
MIFFMREVCVCALLDQTRYAQKQKPEAAGCVERRILMKITEYKKVYDSMVMSEDMNEAIKQGVLRKGRRKTKKYGIAAAVAAVLLCLCFHSQISAFAHNLFTKEENHIAGMDFGEKMDVISIDASVPEESDMVKYHSLDEVEKLLGIDLLQSDDVYQAPIANVLLWQSDNTEVSIEQGSYIKYHEYIDLSRDKEGSISKITDKNHYSIRYEAHFYIKKGTDVDLTYLDGTCIETYTTPSGEKAYILKRGNTNYYNYEAVLYKDNIKYTFSLEDEGNGYDHLKELKKFLDSLK